MLTREHVCCPDMQRPFTTEDIYSTGVTHLRTDTIGCKIEAAKHKDIPLDAALEQQT